jgi:hypothetical protein
MATLRRTALGLAIAAALTALWGCGERGKEKGTETAVSDVPVNVNLLVNPSFEEWEGAAPAGWKLATFAGKGKNPSMVGKSTDEKKTGECSFFLRGLFNTDRWLVLTQRIAVVPGRDLAVSAEIKSDGIKRNRGQEDNANIYVRFLDEKGERLNDRYYADAHTAHRVGTTGWRRDSKVVEVPRRARYAEIGLINQMTGYLYVDDVEAMLQERVQWESINTKYVTFYYLAGHPYPEGAIEEETRMVDFVTKLCDLDIKGKISYYYYPSEEAFKQINRTRAYRQLPKWNEKELHTTAPVEEHAMIHMLLIDLGYPPVGLAKGFVFALRGYYSGWNPHLLAKRFLIGKMVPALFRIVDADAVKESDWAVIVPSWASFCTYLIDRDGMKKFKEFYTACNGVNDAAAFNDLFTQYYGKEFKVVDRAWRLYVLRIETPEPLDSLDLQLPPLPTFGAETIDTMEMPNR